MVSSSNDYVIEVHESLSSIGTAEWNELLARQGDDATPFMRYEYLRAMHDSGSAVPKTGWTARYMTLRRKGELLAACALYLKSHSYGEYVFDWSWARAYAEHGLAYYPKALIAPPFTPVPGARLLARDASLRTRLLQGVLDWCRAESLSSLHLLFGAESDLDACRQAGLMLRDNVQFHWENRDSPYRDFEDFLHDLNQEKRKKIRQERRKVEQAGVHFRHARGADIDRKDWDFFYRCYERTYLEHGNPPYLLRAFFKAMQETMPENWVLFIAERDGQPIASSLIALSDHAASTQVAYGRYWGALERVDCLHFEACYYQPLQWCIANGFRRFEGGAQGEHKMARALLPVKTASAHWLAHPAFADAVDRFLEREKQGVGEYFNELTQRSPMRRDG